MPSLVQSFKNWYPKYIVWQSDKPILKWQNIGDKKFCDPFYLDTLSRALSDIRTGEYYRDTSLSVLDEFAEQLPAREPDGFIFHLSRCGSTLLANLLRCHPQHLVISEAPPLDHMLRYSLKDPSISTAQQHLWFKTLVSIIGRQQDAQPQRYFIKFDCWHAPAISLIRQLYPNTPCLFLYRSPDEVLASHHKIPGTQVIPGLIEAEWYTSDSSTIKHRTHLEYGVWVIEQILSAALLAQKDQPMLLVNYHELATLFTPVIAPFFNISSNDKFATDLNNTLQCNSKEPSQKYHNDTRDKQAIAKKLYSESQLAGVNRLYAAMEKERLNQRKHKI